MAGHNRYLRGETNQIKVPVHGNVVVEPGDFILLGGVTRVSAAKNNNKADYYGYPVSGCTQANAKGVVGFQKNWFLGVAMDGSPSGSTRDISVAQTGIFRYPITPVNSSTGTTIGYKVTGVTPASATSGGSNQWVSMQGHASTTAYLGYCVISQAGGASFVDFSIRGKYCAGGLAT